MSELVLVEMKRERVSGLIEVETTSTKTIKTENVEAQFFFYLM